MFRNPNLAPSQPCGTVTAHIARGEGRRFDVTDTSLGGPGLPVNKIAWYLRLGSGSLVYMSMARSGRLGAIQVGFSRLVARLGCFSINIARLTAATSMQGGYAICTGSAELL